MSKEVFEVLEGGLFSTLQDAGRRGFKRFGVPESGPMDGYAFQAGNLLLNNHQGALALEFTFPAPRLLALQDTSLVITGASFTPSCNGWSIPQNQVVSISQGSQLSFSSLAWGRWCYLFVPGGFFSSPVLGSSSTYLKGGFGGMNGRSLQRGDILYGQEGGEVPPLGKRLSSFSPSPYGRKTIRLLPGPQFQSFTLSGRKAFFQGEYRIGLRWDRIGYFLEGPEVASSHPRESISEGLTPGAVQILGDGTPVVMMADAQTIGGYKKMGWVLKEDLPSLVQTGPGVPFRFSLISREEAQAVLEKGQHWAMAFSPLCSFRLTIKGRCCTVLLEKERR